MTQQEIIDAIKSITPLMLTPDQNYSSVELIRVADKKLLELINLLDAADQST